MSKGRIYVRVFHLQKLFFLLLNTQFVRTDLQLSVSAEMGVCLKVNSMFHGNSPICDVKEKSTNWSVTEGFLAQFATDFTLIHST